jgi:hypothetical protein
MEKDDTVVMKMIHGIIFVSPIKEGMPVDGEKKLLSAGRFNLPQGWARENCIDVGDFVYLIATDEGIVLCAKNMELTCVGEVEA